MRRLLAGAALIPPIAGATLLWPAPAAADICPYPGVGVGVNVLFGRGGHCDYPTEINGAHMHCETGGFGLGGGIGFSDGAGGLSGGLGGSGISGAGCSWRCPDGVMAPAPNPPGAWNKYLVPVETAFCVAGGHMTPNGFWSEPVLPTEGIPPAAPDAPPPEPHLAPAPGEPPALTPGEPNP